MKGNKLDRNEIADVIKNKLLELSYEGTFSDEGRVVQVGDSIAYVYGLGSARMGEEVLFIPGNLRGLVLHLEEDLVGVAIFDDWERIKENHKVVRTGRLLAVPVGVGMLGRVIDPLGKPLDGKGGVEFSEKMVVERKPVSVLDREGVSVPLHTGILAVDSLVPIGRGQRELIIGDRKTGKTALVVDTIIAQKFAEPPVYCFYVAIGKKNSDVVEVKEVLEKHGAMDYTVIVSAPASSSPSLQFVAPYAATAMAEYFAFNGQDALVIFDDLSKHAVAYRQLSLLLRRPPGREAYPGDIFYIHSRLLERGVKLSKELGGGSITMLPIVETLEGNISAYIPTNLISITDGQIYLEPDLFNAGQKPAINAGLSVSRVGGRAQTKAMKKVAPMLRLELAQYRELEVFAKLGTELDSRTRATLTRGRALSDVLVQRRFRVYRLWEEVALLKAATSGWFDGMSREEVGSTIEEMLSYLSSEWKDLVEDVEREKRLDDKREEKLTRALESFFSMRRENEGESPETS